MVSILRALLVGLALWAAGAMPAAEAQAPAGPVLRVGTFPDNPPWEFREDGHLVGFEVDLIEAIGTRLGMRIDFVGMAFGELLPALAGDRIDVAMCSMSITPERRRRFDFTQPYYRTSQGMVVMKSARVRSLEDLAGKRVGTEAGSTNEQWLSDNRARYGFGPTVPVVGLERALELLSAGEIDAYFGDLPALLYQLLKRPELAVVERLPTEDRYAMALRLNSPLTARIDGALSGLKKDGTLAAIHQRWFGMKPEPDSPVITVLPRP
ncbi:extracellular solute-binding protein family 3 [Ancylobacter novellus DSM 506]|uniref:Extracellular solute-binding protein family 3 n=1 Tax=Ancylobacter novellus (strain ATCC 8093 / DSM 506 / JCM 20403 / CCM 1077 / IAM 12100 / NBRC 12443 / NCIMB 10456) TaxID=639283 RepID=D7A7U3_ANCN5|nr:ABC transporter substrate-binding protein [Ancylobacter novellus]ADH90401.1 extracellular solute-binding protein family 3 [Ancylobacter novellus DSM 506]